MTDTGGSPARVTSTMSSSRGGAQVYQGRGLSGPRGGHRFRFVGIGRSESKHTQAECHLRDGHGEQRCGNCQHFEGEGKCAIVQSGPRRITSNTLCDYIRPLRMNDTAVKMSNVDLTAETATASTVPEPFGKPSGPGLWHVKGMELPAYIQHVAHDLLEGGRVSTVSEAIRMAKGIVQDWADGRTPNGKGHVHPDVQAAAKKAIAEWEAKRARAHAQHAAHEHEHTGGTHVSEVDLASTAERKPKKAKQTTVSQKFPHLLTGAPRQNEAGRVVREAGRKVPESGRQVPESGSKGPATLDTLAQATQRSGGRTHRNMTATENMAQKHADAEAALGPNHPHTQRLKNQLDAHLAGHSALKSSMVDHLRNTHRMAGDHEGKTFDHLSSMHSADHAAHPNLHHSHKKGLEPRRDMTFSQDTEPRVGPSQIHFDIHGQPVDLAGGASVVGKAMAHHKKKGKYIGFAALVKQLMEKGHSRADAERIAAFIGRKKYGAAFQAAAASGRTLGRK